MCNNYSFSTATLVQAVRFRNPKQEVVCAYRCHRISWFFSMCGFPQPLINFIKCRAAWAWKLPLTPKLRKNRAVTPLSMCFYDIHRDTFINGTNREATYGRIKELKCCQEWWHWLYVYAITSFIVEALGFCWPDTFSAVAFRNPAFCQDYSHHSSYFHKHHLQVCSLRWKCCEFTVRQELSPCALSRSLLCFKDLTRWRKTTRFNIQQERKCTYKVTLSSVHKIIVTVEKQ